MKQQSFLASELHRDVGRYGEIIDNERKQDIYQRIRQGTETVEDRETLLLGQMRHAFSSATLRHLQGADVENRFQDCYAKLIERMERFDPEKGEFSTFTGWAISSANRNFWYRRGRNKEFTQHKATQADRSDNSKTPLEQLANSDCLEQSISKLQEALKKLRLINENWYQLVVEYYGLNGTEPKTTGEIAKERKQSKSNISQNLRNAMKNLKYLMGVNAT